MILAEFRDRATLVNPLFDKPVRISWYVADTKHFFAGAPPVEIERALPKQNGKQFFYFLAEGTSFRFLCCHTFLEK
jgi:hypothetical protein